VFREFVASNFSAMEFSRAWARNIGWGRSSNEGNVISVGRTASPKPTSTCTGTTAPPRTARSSTRTPAYSALELDPAPKKPGLTPHDEPMPPRGVGPGRKQTDHHGSLLRRSGRLLHPHPDDPTVGRVHGHDIPAPILSETVVCPRAVARALGVLRRCARV